jgi:hypothetical protein
MRATATPTMIFTMTGLKRPVFPPKIFTVKNRGKDAMRNAPTIIKSTVKSIEKKNTYEFLCVLSKSI